MQLDPLSINSSSDIEVLSNFISSALISSAKKVIPSSKPRPFLRQNLSPGLKSTHTVSKQKYREWISGGRPGHPDHPLKKAYKEAKRAFR